MPNVRTATRNTHMYSHRGAFDTARQQILVFTGLGIAVVLQVPTIILMPLAVLFGFRLRAGSAELECENLVLAFRRQRTRVIELENKLASGRGL